MIAILKEIKKETHKLKKLYDSSELVQTACYFAILLFVFFVVLPFVLGTSSPINSVVSSSMEHHSDVWRDWLSQHGFTTQDIENIMFKTGFNAGDMVIAVAPKNIKKGDVVLYNLKVAAPEFVKNDFIVIHRVVEIKELEGKIFYITKGDNNPREDYITKGDNNPKEYPVQVPENAVIGKAVLVIPYLGWPRKIINDLL